MKCSVPLNLLCWQAAAESGYCLAYALPTSDPSPVMPSLGCSSASAPACCFVRGFFLFSLASCHPIIHKIILEFKSSMFFVISNPSVTTLPPFASPWHFPPSQDYPLLRGSSSSAFNPVGAAWIQPLWSYFYVAAETFCLVAKGRPPLAKDRDQLWSLISGVTRGKATLQVLVQGSSFLCRNFCFEREPRR